MSLVVQQPDSNLALVPTDEDVRKMMMGINEITSMEIANARKERSIKSGGFSVPVRVESSRQNKQSADTQELSYNTLVTFGSFNNWPITENVIVKNNMVFIKLNPGKNIKDALGHLPTSRILGTEITHALLYSGDRRLVFTDSENVQMFDSKRFAYMVSMRPTYTIKTLTAADTENGKVKMMTYASSSPGNNNNFLAQTNNGMPPISGIATMPDSSTTTRSVMINEFLEAALKILPDKSPCLEPFLPKAMQDAYIDSESQLTPGERLAIEMMFPDMVPNRVPPDPKTGAPTVPSYVINCEELLPIHIRQYPGQDDVDLLSLYNTDPTIETYITPELIQSRSQHVMIVAARQKEQYHNMMQERVTDVNGTKSFITTVAWGGAEDTSGEPSQQKSPQQKSPYSVYNKRKNGQIIALRGVAHIISWPRGAYMVNAKETDWRVTLYFTIYSNVLAKFGISNLDTWIRFAPYIVNNTDIWMAMYCDGQGTARLRFNQNGNGSDRCQKAIAKVTDIVHNLATALRTRIGVPVTPTFAAKLARIEYPSPKVISSMDPKQVPNIINLSECGMNQSPGAVFASTLSANCDYFVLVDNKLVEENVNSESSSCGFLKDVTPEIGDAMFATEWYNINKDVTMPSGAVFAPLHPLRQRAMMAGRISETTPKLVFAVRKPLPPNIDRAKRITEIFQNGGMYDSELGFPIIDAGNDMPTAITPNAVPLAICTSGPTAFDDIDDISAAWGDDDLPDEPIIASSTKSKLAGKKQQHDASTRKDPKPKRSKH